MSHQPPSRRYKELPLVPKVKNIKSRKFELEDTQMISLRRAKLNSFLSPGRIITRRWHVLFSLSPSFVLLLLMYIVFYRNFTYRMSFFSCVRYIVKIIPGGDGWRKRKSIQNNRISIIYNIHSYWASSFLRHARPNPKLIKAFQVKSIRVRTDGLSWGDNHSMNFRYCISHRQG